MPKRKTFNRRALSCTSTRTHLEGRRSVELMDLPFKPVRASRVQGFQGPYGGPQLVLTLYRIYIFCFQMCNPLPELMKNGDAGILPLYYSLKYMKCVVCVLSSHLFWTSNSLEVPTAQDFSPTFLLRCVPLFFSREGFSPSFPSSTVKSSFVY